MAILNDTVVNGDLTVTGSLNGENKDATLDWDKTITLAELPGIQVTAKLPPNPNTDYRVQRDAHASGNLYLCGSTSSSAGTGTLVTSSTIYASSGGQLNAVAYNARSDARLKENFNPFHCANSILDLPIYKYDFKNGPKNQIGCKAQDLLKICPDLVTEGEDGYLSIQESKLIFLLLQEVKTLKAEINTLSNYRQED